MKTSELMARTASMATKLFGGILTVLGLLGVGLLMLSGDGGWISGPALVPMFLTFLFVSLGLLVICSAVLSAVISMVIPKKPELAANLAIILAMVLGPLAIVGAQGNF